MYFEHKPVLIEEAIDLLNIKKDGIYVDATVGGGGYALKILSKLESSGKLIAVDCDQEALENLKKKFKNYHNVILVKDNFSNIEKILNGLNIKKIDGVVFDLGVSTHQLSCAQRGFSFKGSDLLDMRMDLNLVTSAKDLINNLTAQELEKIFTEYGEEKFSRRISKKIVEERLKKEICTTYDLVEIIRTCVPSKFKNQRIHFATRTFQALRIAVNNELKNLEKAVIKTIDFLKKEGRIVVISYHSLEDRIVKNIFRENSGKCSCDKKLPKCICEIKNTIKILTRKPIAPKEKEIEVNPKSRSAKLRAAEKI